MSEARNTRRRYAEKNRRKVGWAARNVPCVRCSQPIDYSLQYPDPGSCSEEHIKPWSTHPHLRDDPANLGPAHLDCNRSRGNRAEAPALGMTGQEW